MHVLDRSPSCLLILVIWWHEVVQVPNTKSWKFLFLKTQKQGDSGAQPALYLFQSLYSISYTLKLIAVLSFWARANAMSLTSLIVHHYGSFTYTIITPRSSMWWHKALHLPEIKEEKETYERHTCQFVSKKGGEMKDAWLPLRTYISTTLAHDPSDRPSHYHETSRLHLQNECVRHALPLPKLHILLMRNRENKVRFE